MANRLVTPILGARLEAENASGSQQHALGTTVIVQSSGEMGTAERRIAVYLVAGEIISTSAGVAINTNGTASASAGGYVALGSANQGEYFWARSSAVIA